MLAVYILKPVLLLALQQSQTRQAERTSGKGVFLKLTEYVPVYYAIYWPLLWSGGSIVSARVD